MLKPTRRALGPSTNAGSSEPPTRFTTGSAARAATVPIVVDAQESGAEIVTEEPAATGEASG